MEETKDLQSDTLVPEKSQFKSPRLVHFFEVQMATLRLMRAVVTNI